MPTRFPGSKPDDFSKFEGEAIRLMQVDPNLSRFGDVKIDEKFAERLAREGQLEPGLIRKGPGGEPILFAGNRRRLHILWINDHPERWSDWGLSAPMTFAAKYKPVTEAQARELALSENLERAELRPIDKAQIAQAYRLQDREEAWIADRLRVSTARIRQLLDLFSLGDAVLALVDEGILTEAAARSLKKLTADQIAEVVAGIRAGSKPHEVLTAIREQHRASGRLKPRTGREVLKALEAVPGTRAHDFMQWLRGDPTVTLEEVFS